MIQNATFDIVVLTTFDEAQKMSFEYFLDEFKHRSEANSLKYKNVEFFVFVDVDFGVKLGSGGSVLFALHNLEEKFGGNFLLEQKRILLIPVSGMSQRQVNGTILGKIFNLAPLAADRETTFFDVKMMSYEKLIPFMPPGVLIAASDILEFYEDLPNFEDRKIPDSIFKKDGFTVLAFKSDLKTAFNHGCYIFERKPEHDSAKFVEIHDDIRLVLQKPTAEELIKNHACFVDQETAEKYTYIDGVLFVGFDAVETLINFIRSEKFRIDSEICTFGDFLRPLGAQNSIAYAKCSTQKKLYHLLRPFSIRGLIFRNSVFYHMGTFPELLRHYCSPLESSFMKNFGGGIKPISNCIFLPKKCDTVSVVLWTSDKTKNNNLYCPNRSTKIRGCVMSSIITDDSIVPEICILEKCYLPNGVKILGGNSAILSNISCPDQLIIDRSIVMCTMSLSECIDGKNDQKLIHITAVFDLSIDVKKEYSTLESFHFFDRPLLQWIKLWNRMQEDCNSVSNNDRVEQQIFGANPKTLWYARIFPGFSTMEESSSETWKAVEKLTGARNVDATAMNDNGNEYSVNERKVLRLFSMDDAFKMKNVPDMLNYRQKLIGKIIYDSE